jgi:hypothetical protein
MPGVRYLQLEEKGCSPPSVRRLWGAHAQVRPEIPDPGRQQSDRHARRSSLMLVFARVCASTFFTITAQ